MRRIPAIVTSHAAIELVVKHLDASRATTHFQTYDHFRRALAIWEAALRRVPIKPWLEACRGVEFGLDPLARALAILLEQAAENYDDILGGVYMVLGQGNRRFGQYFTPFPVARMMAEVTLGDVTLPAPGAPPLTFLEPCVGSGVLILAAADVIEERFPGAIAQEQVQFYGQDIDECCVALCRLNMLMHGIGRRVEQADAMTASQQREIARLLGDAGKKEESSNLAVPASDADPDLIPIALPAADELWSLVEASSAELGAPSQASQPLPRRKPALRETPVKQLSLL